MSSPVGLLIAVVFKMMMPLVKKREFAGLMILVAVFVAIGVLRLPLQMVLLVAMIGAIKWLMFEKCSIAASAWRRTIAPGRASSKSCLK